MRLVLTPNRTSEEYETQKRLTLATLLAIRPQWRRMSGDWEASWRTTVGPRVTTILAAAQLGTVRMGSQYVPEVLEELGQGVPPVGRVNPAPFVGRAADGRDLSSLLSLSVVRARQAGDLEAGLAWLEMVTETELEDAHRQAIQVATVARPRVGYVRMVNTPCCRDCAVQAGRFFRANAGFLRHPHCFPAGVTVNGPRSEAATRRWYEGELVVLTTASGQELPLTGNHPVLTSRGWVPANLIKEGDEVIRSTQPEGATPLVVPDHNQVPARVEDVWAAFSVAGFDTMPTSPEDFHGDGQHGEVDVVRANGSLNGWGLPPFAQEVQKERFAVAARPTLMLDVEGASVLLDRGHLPHPYRLVGRSGLFPALRGAHGGGPHGPGLAHVAPLNVSFGEALGDRPPRHPVLLGESVLARPRKISLDDLVNREIAGLPRWDAPGGDFSVEAGDGYARLGRDLLHRLSGQVGLDRVVKVFSRQFEGHVYSLTSSEGWHVANSLIVSNCRCYHLPTSDPASQYATYPDASEVTGLTVGERKALEAGGDFSQVLNAKRGRSADKMTTTEGRLRGVRGRGRGSAYQRLTPDGIYRLSSSDEQARDLLRRFGYLT